jgi:3-dehydroshikimate dehydratase
MLQITPMLIPGLVSITFRKLTVEQIISLAVDAGLRSIEWGGDVHAPCGDLARAKEIRSLCVQAGMAVSAFGSYYCAGVSENNGVSFSTVLQTARELGASTIRVWAGRISSAQAPAGFRQAVISDLQRICQLSVAADCTVSLEFHGGTLADSAEATNALIAAAAQPNLSTYWQPPVGMTKDACVASLRTVTPHLQNLHVFHWWPDDRHRLPLAQGVDRWREYLTLAAASGTRHVSLEFVRQNDVQQFRDDAKTLHAMLRSLGQN